MEQNFILLAIPFFFLSIGIELWYSRRKGARWYNFEDTITNLNLGIGSQAVGIMTKLLIVGSYHWVYENGRLFDLPQNHWPVWIAALLLFDYIYYWAHRLGHEWNYMWGAHIVHHQSTEFNLSVALRQSWFHNLISFFMFLPMALLGFHTYVLVGVAAFTTLYQYWIHTRAIKKLPRIFEYVLNTPSHHRVHHATNAHYIDKNYAATFIIWDRLHNTFAEEKEEPVYGITKPFDSLNPIWANLHFYKEMAEGMKREKGFRNKLALCFRGPQYLGKLLNEPVPEPKTAVQAALPVKLYVLTQFVILSAGLVKYLMHFEELSTFYKISGFALIIATTHICAGLLENKRAAIVTEVLRITAALLVLNSLYYFNYAGWFAIMLTGSLIISVVSAVWLLLNLKPGKLANR
jgi:sterol desaturase/sphingolipid hydroxylase (fatty acid hydroxylase superfamily)